MTGSRFLVPLGLAAAGLALLQACSGGSGGPSGPGVVGVVRSYTDEPLGDTTVRLDDPNGPATTVGPDGRFSFAGVTAGTHVVRVGDFATTAVFSVPVVVGAATEFLPRPLFVPSLESGVSVALPPVVGVATVISGAALDGVALGLALNASLSYPSGAPAQVTLVGVSPSRLPVALPNGLVARAAYALEPSGLRITPSAALTLPRLDGGTGALDLWKLDARGSWTIAGALAPVGSFALTAPVDEGAVYAAVPRTSDATTTLTGRIVSGARPIAGYRVECWSQVSEPTGADGLFKVERVPTSFGAFLVRAFPAQPGMGFAPEVVTQLYAAGQTQLGDLTVTAPPPLTVRPKVLSTAPADRALGVPRETQVFVRFSTAVDPKTLRIDLKGTRGPVSAQTFLSNAFSAVLVPVQPLDPTDTYSIVVDPAVRDFAGNTVDDQKLVFRFTTVGGTSTPSVDQKIFGLTPLRATSATLVKLSGQNFPGGSNVRVGGNTAFVTLETADTIQFFPPVAEPASDAAISVVNSAQTTVTSLAPLVLDLRASVASISSPTVVRSAPPGDLFAIGQNVASGTLLVDGAAVAAIGSTESFGGVPVVVSLRAALSPSVLQALQTGPVVVRGANGKAGETYRFLQVRD